MWIREIQQLVRRTIVMQTLIPRAIGLAHSHSHLQAPPPSIYHHHQTRSLHAHAPARDRPMGDPPESAGSTWQHSNALQDRNNIWVFSISLAGLLARRDPSAVSSAPTAPVLVGRQERKSSHRATRWPRWWREAKMPVIQSPAWLNSYKSELLFSAETN